MELMSADVEADHSLFDWQRDIVIEIFNPTTETWTSYPAVKALRRQATNKLYQGGQESGPATEASFSVPKSKWPGSGKPQENDRITDSYDGTKWRVIYEGGDECTLGSRWRVRCVRDRVS